MKHSYFSNAVYSSSADLGIPSEPPCILSNVITKVMGAILMVTLGDSAAVPSILPRDPIPCIKLFTEKTESLGY